MKKLIIKNVYTDNINKIIEVKDFDEAFDKVYEEYGQCWDIREEVGEIVAEVYED